MRRKTLTQYLIEQQRLEAVVTPELRLLIEIIARTCKSISALITKGALGNSSGDSGDINVQGEIQKRLDIIANDMLVEANDWGGHLAAMASEEMSDVYQVPFRSAGTEYLLLFDPIDGSSNIDVNAPIGTIFSVLPVPVGASGRPIAVSEFLQPGRNQLAAGYAIYGPQTGLMLTVGNGTAEFILDRENGTWVLISDQIRLPPGRREFAANISNHQRWEPTVRAYIDDCLLGSRGPRAADFNMRWSGSMVADIHRIIKSGGVFLYPQDDRANMQAGKLRLLYEANPMAFLIEQAGGMASNGTTAILDVMPTRLHERVSIFTGDPAEVSAILRYTARRAAE